MGYQLISSDWQLCISAVIIHLLVACDYVYLQYTSIVIYRLYLPTYLLSIKKIEKNGWKDVTYPIRISSTPLGETTHRIMNNVRTQYWQFPKSWASPKSFSWSFFVSIINCHKPSILGKPPNETIQLIATLRPAVPDLIAGIAHEGHVTHLTKGWKNEFSEALGINVNHALIYHSLLFFGVYFPNSQ